MEVILEEKKRIRSLTKLLCFLITIALICTQLKGVLFDLHEWGLQFPGWFPFKVNSFPTYCAGFLYQFILGYNLVIGAQAFSLTYTAVTGHFCCQVRILSMTIENIFEGPRNPKLLERSLKEVVRHHQVLIEFHRLMQRLFDLPLLALATAMVSMLCLVCYVVTDPESKLIVVIPLLTVVIPEMVILCYMCFAGQRIIDESDYLTKIIYSTRWYIESAAIRRYMAFILMKSQKTFKLRGGGLQTFNLEGLTEILQASYTYFNMLAALRK